jgi:hypothetical protein
VVLQKTAVKELVVFTAVKELVVKKRHLKENLRCLFLTGLNYTLSFLLGIPFIGTSLLIENIILFLKRLKLMKPLAFLMMVLILELMPSTAPFDNRR